VDENDIAKPIFKSWWFETFGCTVEFKELEIRPGDTFH
jgi:hypothetical protein